MSVPLFNAFYYKVLNRENKYSKTRFSTPFFLSYIMKLHIGASITGHLSRYPNVGTQYSGKVSMRRLFPTYYVKLAHLLIVFSPCLAMIPNMKYVLCEISKSGLSNHMQYIVKLLFAFAISLR